jgi:predicted nucleic acid-binding protein
MPIVDLERVLGDAERVLLDSSALISYHSPQERTHSLARHVLERIRSVDDPLRGYISAVSVSELLIRPLRTGDAEYTYMHGFLTNFPNLTQLSMDTVVAVEAATLRAVMRLALPDAVVIATGILSNCEVIISNDLQWKQRGAGLFPRFRWVYLGDYL